MTVAVYTPGGLLIQTLDTYSNINGYARERGAYERKEFDLKAFVGQTIRIGFRTRSEPPYPTIFRVDNVSLTFDDIPGDPAWTNVLRGGALTSTHGQPMTFHYAGSTCATRLPLKEITPRGGTTIWPFSLDVVHIGIDIAPRGDSKVRPIRPGTLVRKATDEAGGYGWWCEVAHSDGTSSLYGHLAAQCPLAVPTDVDLNTILGTAGNTGVSFGDHVHLEVRRFVGNPYHPDWNNAYGVEGGTDPNCIRNWNAGTFASDWLNPLTLR
jgi:murein DD-endopeptidase MepM/ murein hydrolase activator NlpD